MCLLPANDIFLVSVPYHSFLSAFVQLSCHASFLTDILAWFLCLRLPIQLGKYIFVQIWTSIRVCLNELLLLFLLVSSFFCCHHFPCESQCRSVRKNKLLEAKECKVFDNMTPGLSCLNFGFANLIFYHTFVWGGREEYYVLGMTVEVCCVSYAA